MKHSKEWHTCDRCGAEIEIVPDENNTLFRFPTIRRKIFDEPVSLEEFSAYRMNCINNFDYSIKGIESVVINEEYRMNTKRMELCHKCRKDFEAFMRNER